MAKIVIAGRANCPYFARVELLADALAKNLPNFNVHKILIQPHEWEEWLKKTCEERNWTHTASPIVWRELVDRGGKGLYMGGANELQEYAKIYYNLTSSMISNLQLNIAEENLQTKIEIDEERKKMWIVENLIKVCISNAHHSTCYNLVHHLVSGEVFGKDVQISLRLLTNEESLEEVRGMEMEIMDLGFPLVRETIVTAAAGDSLNSCHVIIILDEVAKHEEESQQSWLQRNQELFENLGQLINGHADKDAKIVVAGDGPVNFNADILIKNAPDISPTNIVAVSRTLENQAKAILAQKLQVNSAEVVDVVVWGDPTGTNFVDVSNARVHNYDGAIWGPPFYSRSCVEMAHDNKWLATEFQRQLQGRKKATEEMLKHKTTMSKAASIQTLLKHWWNGSPEEQVFSLGVRSDGSAYDIPADIVFSLPVKFTAGSWQVADNLNIDDETKQKIKEVVQAMIKSFGPMDTQTVNRTPTPGGNSQNNNNEMLATEDGESQVQKDENSAQMDGLPVDENDTTVEADDKPTEDSEKPVEDNEKPVEEIENTVDEGQSPNADNQEEAGQS